MLGSDGAPGLPIDPDLVQGDEEDRWPSPRQRHAPHVEMAVVLAIGLGGVIGAVARYAVSLGLPTETGRFPWGTFLINVSGAAVLGFFLVVVVEQIPRGRLVRAMIGTGIIGAYTTFSTYVVEAVLLVRAGDPVAALAYLLGSVLAGIVAVWLGMTAARKVLRARV